MDYQAARPAQLFIDGALVRLGSGDGADGAITTDLRALGSERYWITKRPGPGNPHFEGLMDELVIYNRDLTAEELQELIKK